MRVSQKEIDELLKQWLQDKLDEDRTARLRPWHQEALNERNEVLADVGLADADGEPIGPVPQYQWEADEAEDEREEWEHRLKTHRFDAANYDVSELLKRSGIDLEPTSTEYRLLCQGICRAMVEFWRIAKARTQGDWADELKDPLFKVAQAVSTHATSQALSGTLPRPQAPQPPVSELLERCLKERKVAGKTEHDYRTALRALTEVAGDRQLHDYQKRDVLALKDALLLTPSNWSKRFPGKSLPEAIKLNEKRHLPTLAAKTINMKYLTNLRTFFNWALANEHISTNPTQGVRVEVSRKDKGQRKRLPFTDEQLIRMFKAPLFTGCLSKTRIFDTGAYRVKDHRYWVPLLALFTGARANELGQLEVADFRTVEGIQCLDLRESADEGRTAKQLKSSAAHRLVPIHPELEKLGFLEYLAQQKRNGSSRLFPQWKVGQDGYYSSIFSKFFARFCDQCVTNDKRITFHSLRHCFVDALRRAGVPEDMRMAIVGHEPSDRTHSGYGLGFDAHTLYAALAKVKYSELDLSHLYPQKN